MKAFAEPVQWLIRVGEHAEKYGDPYDHAVAVRELNRWTCELVGYVEDQVKPTCSGLQAVLRCVANIPGTEYRTAILRRIHDGQENVKEYNLKRYNNER